MKEIQMKAIMTFYYTINNMAKVQEPDNTKC